MAKHLKVIVEKHADTYVAYPLGAKGVVVGEGQTYEEALADARSAIGFHLESFGSDALEPEAISSSGPGSADSGSSG
jgi:predicted RNase H-like HicB family nuclease